jgi:hypothetical protein
MTAAWAAVACAASAFIFGGIGHLLGYVRRGALRDAKVDETLASLARTDARIESILERFDERLRQGGL